MDLVAGFTYQGTFTRAERQARLHKASTTAVPFASRTGQWLAINNVAYFFSFGISQHEIDLVTVAVLPHFATRAGAAAPGVATGHRRQSPRRGPLGLGSGSGFGRGVAQLDADRRRAARPLLPRV